LINVDDKSAYPYITKFKKEPFKSFITIKRKEIKSFYYRNNDKLIEFYQHFNQNLLNVPQLNLETIYWFLLLKKYLKKEKIINREEIFEFIKKCEVRHYEMIGFKFSPYSDKIPDIYSTYLALSCLKNLGILKEYLISEKQTQIKGKIKNFVITHKKGNNFLHCQDKECEICKNSEPTKILYYILEIFSLLGIDVRNNREQFRSYLSDKKKDSSVIFRLLCLKYLELDSEVKDKELHLLQQQQKESGGFSFNQMADINITFWLVYALELYSWLLDYNPTGIYSYINQKLEENLAANESWDYANLHEVSKLVVLLSLIWRKFIEELERVIFRHLEKEQYIDVNQVKTTFGFTGYIEDIISYINFNYNFNLKVIDNEAEFGNYLNKLSEGKKKFLQIFYSKLKNNSIISLTDLLKKYRTFNYGTLKLREEIFPIIKEMVERKIFIGNLKTKKTFLGFKTKHLFYLDYLLKEIIISNMELDTEKIYEEKEKLEDIKNDIYNMTLKLTQITSQIREEIESYLLIDEIEYAKERLKFILRNALMEADFLNENIESSFNETLKYVNIQASLGVEISQWKKLHSVLQKKLSDTGSYLQSKIQEKEDLRNLNGLLESLMEKVSIIEEDLKKRLDNFRKLFNETFEKEYNNKNLNLIIEDLDRISQNVKKYDEIVYNVSQKVTTREKQIVKKHKKIINKWVKVKDYFNNEFNYYTEGFHFFNINLQKIEEVNEQIKIDIFEINKKAKSKIMANEFKDAFNITKKETDLLLNKRLDEIKELQSLIKQKIKKRQKLYVLYRHLQDKLEVLESNVIELFANELNVLKNKIIKERNRSKLEDFDDFTSQKISELKSQLTITKNNLNQSPNLTIDGVIKKFDSLKSDYEKTNKIYIKKLNDYRKNIDHFEEKSELSIIQWEKFSEFLIDEISVLKDDCINQIISSKLSIMTIEKKTNTINLVDLKDEVKLSCKVLINKLKDMIEISKINAEINEKDKQILVYTDDYYLNKQLKNYIDKNLLKLNRDRIGKILALYDSSIRNGTLSINMLELQNRINDLRIFKDVLPKQFYEKVRELQINQDREDFIEIKEDFESILENERVAINKIKYNLSTFTEMRNFITQQFNTHNIELKSYTNKVFKETESYSNYLKIQESFENNKLKIENDLKKSQTKIEEKIHSISNKSEDADKLIPEIRELYVKTKNEFSNYFNHKIQKINDHLNMMKNESFREQLLNLVNKKKIHLSQLLGNLERKVEDNIEIKEFKRSNALIQKRAKSIEREIKKINKSIDSTTKDFTKQSKNFKQISKFILEDFNKFIDEYSEILTEKVKALERLILKAYINMTIKAVANEYLTIGFLNNELKIKKQNIQDHLLYLISNKELNGKYDPRFGIYYENPEILDDLDEAELEVIKNTNFKINMMLRHLRNFASQYGSIIAFFASVVTISYYLFLFSGGNPAVIALPIIITILLITFYFFRKSKDEKIK
jgi:hypothetical protein